MFTRGKFLELLKSLDPEPNFFISIINFCFSKLPDVVSSKLAQQLYLKYYFTGDKLIVINNITHEEHYFTSNREVYDYLKVLGYKPGMNSISVAFREGSTSYCNHTFIKEYDKEKEITYFE